MSFLTVAEPARLQPLVSFWNCSGLMRDTPQANMGCARGQAEAAKSPLVPALNALVLGLTRAAAECHFQVWCAGSGCSGRQEAGFPFAKPSLGTVAASVVAPRTVAMRW